MISLLMEYSIFHDLIIIFFFKKKLSKKNDRDNELNFVVKFSEEIGRKKN